MQCATHPSVETELACGKCGKAICPRCLVHTPVGARCRQCANVRRLPTYNIPPRIMARAGVAAALGGAALGGLWAVLFPFGLGFYFGLFLGLGLGYALGELVSVAANRKAGLPLQVLAAGGVIVAFLVRDAVLASTLRDVAIDDLLRRDSFGYVVVILAIVVAVNRVR
jgi:hypothetical protein